MINKGITIIICTFNGEERLESTIAHIAKQVVPDYINWEVTLADNGSKDNTIKRAITEWEKYNLGSVKFNIIKETKPGKLYALQNAIKQANFEYLIICDDDNWLANDYVAKAYNLLENRKDIAAVGGKGIPVTCGSFPEWFKDYHFEYAVGPQSEQTGIIKSRGILWGAGLATRRSLYLKMYKQYQSFLPECALNILSAEDTEYCMRLQLKGYKLYYDSSLTFYHFIPPFKLTEEFRDGKLLKGFKDSQEILGKYHAAMRAYIKTKSRWDLKIGLVLIAPINYIFSSSKKRAEKAKNTLYHLLPFEIATDSVSQRIKDFVKSE